MILVYCYDFPFYGLASNHELEVSWLLALNIVLYQDTFDLWRLQEHRVTLHLIHPAIQRNYYHYRETDRQIDSQTDKRLNAINNIDVV